jgi:hypothetical protein
MPRTELRAELEIAAPVAHVYRVLVDFAAYPEWNPFITSIQGKLAIGEVLNVEMSLPEGSTYQLRPKLTQVRENAELRWSGHFWFSGLLEAEYSFQLSERGEMLTHVVQGENFSGFLLRFAGETLTLTARGLVYLNQALKKRAESTWRGAVKTR